MPPRLAAVPNQPKTPHRSFRIPPDLYEAAQRIAAANGDTLTEVVKDALVRYVKRGVKPKKEPKW